MATVAAVHSQPPIVRTPAQVIDSLFQTDAQVDRPKRAKPNRKRVWASLTSSKDTFINDVKAEMIRRDPKHERTWVIVTDGERALQRRVIKTFENVTLVLDLLHALDKLWKAAHVLHPEGSHEAEAFVRHRAERILCGMAGQVVKGLRQTVTKRRLTGQKAKTQGRLATRPRVATPISFQGRTELRGDRPHAAATTCRSPWSAPRSSADGSNRSS